jgi:hypothetical protein
MSHPDKNDFKTLEPIKQERISNSKMAWGTHFSVKTHVSGTSEPQYS